ncbi:MAG: 16S rRNA (cytidine(1402)-2'-O)-methyltransferase, partial [Deltaproteobacteria bacterium]|nr:16S rRNA (cytidine(1402)-2'-O)-methyltransferase [Deltaproteobacteria bacterium]
HEHNEVARAQELINKLTQGSSIALVSDRGMPGISDPGFRLVSLAVERGIKIVPVPGPVAFVAALVASGLPIHSFFFRGFLPAKRSDRLRALAELSNSGSTEVLYEAPHRILELLEDARSVLGGNRPAVLARELTKMHEEFLRGSLSQLVETVKHRAGLKGEITLLLGPAGETEAAPARVSVAERVEEVMSKEGIEQKAALKKVAKERGLSKSEVYRQLQLGKARL